MSEMTLPRRVDTVVVGAGHAGLLASRQLTAAGREHVVLERRATLGGGWQDRWDEFRLVSPNWTLDLPDDPFEGDPDAFAPRDEIVARVARYAAAVRAPVVREAEVRRLATRDAVDGTRFRLDTSQGPIDARSVVVAAGGFRVPHRPPVSRELPDRIDQVHAHDYRRPGDLPPGRILIVGSGQTGVQLLEELTAAGRDVVLSVGRCGRARRRYRGRDFFWWARQLRVHGAAVGVALPTTAELPHPGARLTCNPQLSGHGGGHAPNLRAYGRDGVTLVGRLEGVTGERVRFGPDLAQTLAFADRFFAERIQPDFDGYAERAGLDLPPDEPEPAVEFEPPEVRELDLAGAGISTVLWTSGYRLGLDAFIDLPIFDEQGFPRTDRGISEVPGLSFLGVPWQVNQGSGNLVGVAADAEELAARWD